MGFPQYIKISVYKNISLTTRVVMKSGAWKSQCLSAFKFNVFLKEIKDNCITFYLLYFLHYDISWSYSYFLICKPSESVLTSLQSLCLTKLYGCGSVICLLSPFLLFFFLSF